MSLLTLLAAVSVSIPEPRVVRNIAVGAGALTTTISIAATGDANGYGSITSYTLTTAATNPAVRWAWRPQVSPTGQGTLRAWWRKNGAGAWTPIQWDGQATLTAPTVATITDTTITGAFTAGDTLDVLHLYTWATTGGSLAAHAGTVPTGEAWLYPVTPTTASTVSRWRYDVSNRTVRVSAVLAPSTADSWVYTGDSIAAQDRSFGYLGLLDRGLPFTQSSMGAESYFGLADPGRYALRFDWCLPYATMVLSQYGINDTAVKSVPAMAANALTIWGRLRADGVTGVVQTTASPASTSTDNWTTLENQTPYVNEVARLGWNRWLRDGAPIIDGAYVAPGTEGATRARVVSGSTITPGSGDHPLGAVGGVSDTCAAVESSQDSGLYRVDLGSIGGDGVHPGPGAHALMATKLAADLQVLGF